MDTTALACSFQVARDRESDTLVYESCFGTVLGSSPCDVVPWQPVTVGTSTNDTTVSINATNLDLAVGSTYVCGVRACNLAGLCSERFTNGVAIGKARS